MIKTKCLTCKKEFYARVCEIKIGKGKFCSRKCVYKWQAQIFKGDKSSVWKGGKSKCICKMCGIDFKLEPVKIKNGRGKFCSRKCKGKWQSIFRIGKKHPNWKGGITPLNLQIRHSIEYRLWRESVFVRDGFACVRCGKASRIFEVHHIKSFAKYPELRFAIDNGITLCKIPCHKKVHNECKNK